MYIMAMLRDYLTTKQASYEYGLSPDHIRRLLERGTLRGIKAGHDWLVAKASMERYMRERPRPGRKPKSRNTKPND